MPTCRFFALLLLAAVGAAAQPASPPLNADERTRWFREGKFGVFIHWGPYAVLGRHEWARHRFQIPQAEYDKYARAFHPVRFNADEWAGLAREAGARYMVITSKHHDGFAIWRSKVSDYDMEITPYPGDPLKLLAEAARRQGLRLGFYHSIMDWHHPDYRPRRAWEHPKSYKEGGNNRRYADFMKEQIRELLTGYGDVAMMWFDGEWENTLPELKAEDEIYDFIRGLQPNTLINDRLYQRRPGNKADFGTPEQFVPPTGLRGPDGRPILWEACVTINGESWGYNKYETDFKTERDLIRMLVEVVSKGGNLLLNAGPRPDGTIQEEFVTRLRAIGRWLNVNGEAIYGTTASPFDRMPFYGRATVKNGKLYLHLFQWPSSGELRLPGLSNLVHGARLLADPAARVTTARDGDGIVLRLPAHPPDETASVVELTLDGSPVVTPFHNRPGANGQITLGADSCEIETRFEQRAKKENFRGHVFLTRWTRGDDVPYWTVEIPKAGQYWAEIRYAARRDSAGTAFTLEAGGAKRSGKVESTGNDLVFKTFPLGELTLPAGLHTVRLRAPQPPGAGAMSFESVTLKPLP